MTTALTNGRNGVAVTREPTRWPTVRQRATRWPTARIARQRPAAHPPTHTHTYTPSVFRRDVDTSTYFSSLGAAAQSKYLGCAKPAKNGQCALRARWSRTTIKN